MNYKIDKFTGRRKKNIIFTKQYGNFKKIQFLFFKKPETDTADKTILKIFQKVSGLKRFVSSKKIVPKILQGDLNKFLKNNTEYHRTPCLKDIYSTPCWI